MDLSTCFEYVNIYFADWRHLRRLQRWTYTAICDYILANRQSICFFFFLFVLRLVIAKRLCGDEKLILLVPGNEYEPVKVGFHSLINATVTHIAHVTVTMISEKHLFLVRNAVRMIYLNDIRITNAPLYVTTKAADSRPIISRYMVDRMRQWMNQLYLFTFHTKTF